MAHFSLPKTVAVIFQFSNEWTSTLNHRNVCLCYKSACTWPL